MNDPRPLASVSLDVDNLWSYMKTHGDPGWERRPSYYDVFFPVALEALDALGLTITFFIVGIDAASEANHAALKDAVARGHEVGNHSHEHEPWLHRYDAAKLRAEIERAETNIVTATGQRPVGFRGPGYSWSPTLFEILVDRGYLYDASTLPTFIGPLARAYYFWTAKLTPAQRAERGALFGTAADALRPVRPYRWQLPSGRSLLEIPVTTMPVVKAPFHLSYLLYLSRYSEAAMVAYLRTALAACRLTGTEPSFLLHPLDLLGGDQAPALKFFPGMDLSGARKAAVFGRVLGILGEHFRLVNMSTHARAIMARSATLPLRTPAASVAAVG
ncbi:MAG TPA: polysaccharide deacetylase family protein [Gemmatimonadaceae bacterium]|jgi:peptidoglycan/xylan/chitin deacetylase (PgdA/CDA1 family)|nr:polysaccharide deacetylase family protein [Gemmatimonadaceae bacterium]